MIIQKNLVVTGLFLRYVGLRSGAYFGRNPSARLGLHKRDSQFMTSDCACINICLILLSLVMPPQQFG